MKKRQFLAAALFSAAVMTFGTVSFGEAAESLQIKEQTRHLFCRRDRAPFSGNL